MSKQYTQHHTRTWVTQTVSFRNFDADQKRGMYNLEPKHQRNNVHDREWQQDIIISSLQFGLIPAPCFHQRMMPNGTVQWESLDGKQRCYAILSFMRDKLSVNFEECGWNEYDGEKRFSQLYPAHQQLLENLTIDFKFLNETLDDDDIHRFFQCAQQTKRTTTGEYLNSDIKSPKLKIIQNILNTSSLFTELLQKLKPNNTRFSHLEIVAELLYCFDAFVHKRKTFDVTPKILKQWWKDDSDVIHKPMWTEFVNSVILLMQLLSEAAISNKMSKTTFLPVYWFILNNWEWKTINEDRIPNHEENIRILQHVLKYERDFKGGISTGSNKGGVSKQRYNQLCRIVEEEKASPK